MATEHQTKSPSEPIPQKRKTRKSLTRWGTRFIFTGFIFIVAFFASAWVLSRIPVNTSFANASQGIEIAIIHNGVHVDLLVPLSTPEFDWNNRFDSKDFVDQKSNWNYVLFGWGNRQFYIETPKWSDLKIQTVAYAMTGFGDTVMHVEKRMVFPPSSERCRRLKLSADQYQRLCDFILLTFRTNTDNRFCPIPNVHYRESDAFYEATGNYHLFNTCNVWAGNALKNSGVQVGVWTPTTDGVFACLPDNALPDMATNE